VTTTAPNVLVPPLPAGAEADLWTDAGIRDLYAQIGTVPVTADVLRCPTVAVIAEQHRDGTLGAIDVAVDIDRRHKGLSAAHARELSALLTAGADLAEQWADGQPDPADRLAALRSQLHAAYMALRGEPGNTGDYLRAALDSIDDAIAATP
jgi:hypothetical protein